MSSNKKLPLYIFQEIEEQFEDHCLDKLNDNEDWRPDWGEFEDFVCGQLMKSGACYDDPYDDVALHYAEYMVSSKKQEEFIYDWFQEMWGNWESDYEWEQARDHESRCYR